MLASRRLRFFAIALLVTSGIPWLEWGARGDFLFGIEFGLLTGEAGKGTFSHPAVLLPMIGQLLILTAIFLPRRGLLFVGVAPLFLLISLVFLPGLLAGNMRMVLSSAPFLVLSVLALSKTRKEKSRP